MSSYDIGKSSSVLQNYSTHIVQTVNNDLKRSDSKTSVQKIQRTKSRFSYEHCWQVTPDPLQPLQNRLRHLKHRKSNTVTGVEQVGFAHTSMASVDDSGIEDQNAPLELDSVGGEEEYDPAMASGLT